MKYLALFFALVVAFEHFYILILEMFLIDSDRAARSFSMKRDLLKLDYVQSLFKNQGLYNGFLAAGILFGLFVVPNDGKVVTLFFLGCVIVAAIYGSLTASKRIILVQGMPAIIAFILTILFY